MDAPLISVVNTLLLVTALSVDAFVASFAMGARKVRIPALSVAVINIICTLFLAGSVLLGGLLTPYLPARLTTGVCFLILFSMGVVKLLQPEEDEKNGPAEGRYIRADHYLSPVEAGLLAVALSFDGIGVGFGIGLTEAQLYQIILYSLAFNTAAIAAGCRLGRRLAEKLPLNLSRLSGILFLLLAFLKL